MIDSESRYSEVRTLRRIQAEEDRRSPYEIDREMAQPARSVGIGRSDFDGLGEASPPAERDAAALRASARAAGDSEPPWGGAYSGSETSKRRRQT